MNKRELAHFLRSRREALRPAEAGLPAGGRRRTPGLRREEVAWRAGVSANYYERLEQARAPRPSPQVLSALARALRLSAAESAHLAQLAGQVPAAGEPVEQVPDGVRRLLDGLGPVPAYVLNARQDIVAWNAMAAEVITDFSALAEEERNLLRLSLRFGGMCEAVDGGFERLVAAELRQAAARHPGDAGFAALAADFSAASPDFAAGWAEHDVRTHPVLRKRINGIDLDCQLLGVPGHDLRVAMFTAAPGTPAQDELMRVFSVAVLGKPSATPAPADRGRTAAATATPAP